LLDPTSSLVPEQLLAAIGQAVIATDLQGRIVYWNAAAESLYGWPAAEVLGRDVADVTVPQMSQEMAADVMSALRDGTTWSGGFLVQRRDGSVFPALVTDSGIHVDGELVGIVGVSTNLGSALRPLMERSSDAVLVLGTDAVIRYASPAVDPLFGWQPDDLLGRSFTAYVDSRDHDELYAILHAPMSHPGPVLELRVRSTSGPITAEAFLTDLRDDPVVRGVVCNLRYSERLARLRERSRISDSAHADILQTLFSALMDVSTAQHAPDPGHDPHLDMVGDKLSDAIASLRRLLGPDDGLDQPVQTAR
jgi:PAS domain S-box-containing protein